ncbi:Eco57I restriction-modification methylase domain-containing protein [Halococcus sp. AFM35]|uniref:Eco57I restriction-modification methylase domain-containing protein n=1 Tax=Halococcus sp. AFM35 TaxID=3421653 RepID=UPI003EB7AA43
MSAVEAVQEEEPNSWWTTLKHQGVLLSPIVLEEVFPEGPPSLGEREYENLRRSYKRFRNDPDELYNWHDTVLEDLLGHVASSWVKETHIPAEFRRGDLRPNRVLLDQHDEARAMVWIDDDRVTTDDGEPGRIGIYSGKRTYAQFVRLLRETGTDIGILTNGYQFRVIHATLDHESWTEWDAQAWFQGGEGRGALRGFYGLLSDDVLPSPMEDEEASLIGRIKASRDRQADLSDVMGTQVREAVELLLKDLDALLMEMTDEERKEVLASLTDRDLSGRDELRARYQAAIRIVMRLVVALYAESRELFPKDNPVYYNSYSVEGLFSDLREARIEEGEDTLEKQYSAWPRLQALSRLVYYGSPHSEIPLRAYGGRLFRPPDEDRDDDVLAGLAVFEDDNTRLSDATILEVLEKLKIAEFESGGQRRTGPVDFSDLRTEYIGMMYEGLLDYELREVQDEQQAVVFLNIGDEPALPFSLLNSLDDNEITELVDNLKSDSSTSFLTDGSVSVDEVNQESKDNGTTQSGSIQNETEGIDNEVYEWAYDVVDTSGLYLPSKKKLKSLDPTILEKLKRKAARRLVKRVVRPEETYLVNWDNNRKSTGTYYTPPSLAVPTVRRTLEPLLYNQEGDEQVPKKPEEILDQKVCDPAVGSGTFPVAAVRYITNVLEESFEHHVLEDIEPGEPLSSPLGEKAKGLLNEELLRLDTSNEEWRDKFNTQLKRSVVERCIYGVDQDSLAVELAKLSLWVETLDPDLPFTFLDHKLRVGNSLIGTWISEYQDYPVVAWNRDGGDGRKGRRTKRLRELRKEVIKPQMRTHFKNIEHDTSWFEADSSDENVLENAKSALERVHQTYSEKEREEIFNSEFMENEDINSIRHQMDRWCSIWFWPMGDENNPVLDPDRFYNTTTHPETEETVAELSSDSDLNFFHWELEFPDVFFRDRRGFDAVVGNPPWETVAAETKKFFTRYDPIFSKYSRKRANKRKEDILDSSEIIESSWYRHREVQKGMSKFFKPESYWTKRLEKKAPHSPPEPQYRLQGSGKIDLYRAFVERGLRITNNQGRLGYIVKGTFTSDQPSAELRKELIDYNTVEWAFNFINREGIFKGIHRSERFTTLLVDRANNNIPIKCQFYCKDVSEWQSIDPSHFKTEPADIRDLSPNEYTFIEPFEPHLGKIFLKILHGDTDAPSLQPLQEIDQPVQEVNTSEAGEEFLLLNEAQDKGAKYIESGLWKLSNTDFALPAIEGRMVNNFDSFAKRWVSGRGRSADWDEIEWTEKKPGPQFLANVSEVLSRDSVHNGYKVSFMRKGSSVNRRTMIASLYRALPCLDTAYALPFESLGEALLLDGILNSFIMDFQVRTVLGGSTLSWFLIRNMRYPNMIEESVKEQIQIRAAALNMTAKFWSIEWLYLREKWGLTLNPGQYFCTSEEERIETEAQLNALVAKAYGLSLSDFEEVMSSDEERLTGFYRVDDHLPVEDRRTTKSVKYYRKLLKNEWEPKSELEWENDPDLSWQDLEEVSETLVEDVPHVIQRLQDDNHTAVWESVLRRLQK